MAPVAVAEAESDEVQARLPRQSAPPRRRPSARPGQEAIGLLLWPLLEDGEGNRIAIIGNTRMGKSTLGRIIAWEHRERNHIILAHDDTKREPQIDGTIREHPDDLETNPPDPEKGEDDMAVVFRGNPFSGRVVEVEDVAALAMKCGRRRQPVYLYVDELRRAVSEGTGQSIRSDSLRQAYEQGGALMVSVCVTTQSPARLPAEIHDQSSAVAVMRLGDRARNYMKERLYYDKDQLEMIATLDKGEFIVARPGHDWDGCKYRF